MTTNLQMEGINDIAGFLGTCPPFNRLSPAARQSVAEALEQVHFQPGEALIEAGHTGDAYFLLREGKVEIVKKNGDGEVLLAVRGAGAGVGEIALLTRGPRTATVRAIDSVKAYKLSIEAFEQIISREAAVADYLLEEARSHLQKDFSSASSPLISLSPDRLSAIFARMTPLVVSAGTEVCRQGENGDTFYVIQSGRMEVLAKELEETPILKAVLGPGMTFGEEALLTGKPRSATVKAIEETLLLCLNKKDFKELLEADLAREISIKEAQQMQKEAGAVFLDVRFHEEAEDGQISGSSLLPLGELRVRYRELDPKICYLVYCRSGRRSKIAAFLLSQRGYKALSIAGGMLAWQQAMENEG